MRKRYDSDGQPFSARFDKQQILWTLIFLVLLGASIFLLVYFIHDTILSVVFAATTLAMAAMVVIHYRKAVKAGTIEEGLYAFFVLIGKFFNLLLRPLMKLLKKLGFLKGRFGNANDEHSFIFDFGRRGRQKVAKQLKWKDLTDNAQRVRFIFTKQMNFRIKKGYRFKKNLTPTQIEKDLKPMLKEDEDLSLLFDSYRLARYERDDRTNFDDKLIEKLRELY